MNEKFYPIAGLEEADEPETNINVEEEEGVGQKERMFIAPIPQRGEKMQVMIVIKE